MTSSLYDIIQNDRHWNQRDCPGRHWGHRSLPSTRARSLSLARSKLRLCSANHRPGYWSNLPCDWPSTAWAYSEQETENGPRAVTLTTLPFQWKMSHGTRRVKPSVWFIESHKLVWNIKTPTILMKSSSVAAPKVDNFRYWQWQIFRQMLSFWRQFSHWYGQWWKFR